MRKVLLCISLLIFQSCTSVYHIHLGKYAMTLAGCIDIREGTNDQIYHSNNDCQEEDYELSDEWSTHD